MLFNSLPFAFFFLLVAAGHFALPQRARWIWLLAASCWFYASFIPAYLILLGGMIGVGYATALLMERSRPPQKKGWLAVSVATNLGALGVFKYFNFFNANLHALADFLGWNYSLQTLSLALPLALSFFTFQALSYSFEVYHGRFKAERHLGIYALYMMFFPKLLVGPIEKPQNLLPQFRVPARFDYDRVTSGLRLIAWGFIKKFVVADRLALLVNDVYGQSDAFAGPGLTLAVLFYTFQIYYDFSGYTDVARGTSRILGIQLTQNFNHPNFAHNVGDYWRRWHISLSTWFKTYLYFPMGGNRLGYARQCLNLAVVFFATGLWHGAKWTFIVWGCLHGMMVILELTYKKLPPRFKILSLPGRWIVVPIILTFLFIAFTRIFFRSDSLAQAFEIIGGLGTGWSFALSSVSGLKEQLAPLGIAKIQIIYGLAGIVLLETFQVLQVKRPRLAAIPAWPAWARWPVYIGVTFLILFGQVSEKIQFIYFRF